MEVASKVCPKCGENNNPEFLECWKCKATLKDVKAAQSVPADLQRILKQPKGVIISCILAIVWFVISQLILDFTELGSNLKDCMEGGSLTYKLFSALPALAILVFGIWLTLLKKTKYRTVSGIKGTG